jgi:hypothetical protein
MFMRVCGRAGRSLGLYRARLGVVRGKDDDEGNFLSLKIDQLILLKEKNLT